MNAARVLIEGQRSCSFTPLPPSPFPTNFRPNSYRELSFCTPYSPPPLLSLYRFPPCAVRKFDRLSQMKLYLYCNPLSQFSGFFFFLSSYASPWPSYHCCPFSLSLSRFWRHLRHLMTQLPQSPLRKFSDTQDYCHPARSLWFLLTIVGGLY